MAPALVARPEEMRSLESASAASVAELVRDALRMRVPPVDSMVPVELMMEALTEPAPWMVLVLVMAPPLREALGLLREMTPALVKFRERLVVPAGRSRVPVLFNGMKMAPRPEMDPPALIRVAVPVMALELRLIVPVLVRFAPVS